MMRYLLLGMFVGLMADGMFGWGLGIAPGFSLKNMLLYLLVMLMAIEFAASGRKLMIDLPQIHVWFGLFFMVAFFSWAANSLLELYTPYAPFAGFVALKGGLLDHYLFFLVFFLGVRSEEDLLWLQRWILLVIAAGNVATVMDAYNLPDLNVIETRGDGRVTGPLGEANQYGLFVAMFLPMLVARAWIERGAWRGIFVVGAAGTFWVLLLTVSRGAFMALFIGSMLSTYFLRHHLNSAYVRRVAAIAALGLVAAMFVLGQEYIDLITDRTVGTAEEGDAFLMTSGRTWIWANALAVMTAEPLSFFTGYGWATFRSIFSIAPHNTYIHRFFELGILGALAFVGLLYTVLLWAKRAIDGARQHSLLVPMLIGFVFGFAILCVGIFGVDLANPWYFIWAYVGLAMRGAASLLLKSDPGAATTDDAEKAFERSRNVTKPRVATG